jgi:hypothetical protein
MNTYGLRSINSDSFVYQVPQDTQNSELLKRTRNLIVTVFKVQNLFLNILGYIPALSLYSGSFRATSAVITKAVFFSVSKTSSNETLKKWAAEAQSTANAQLLRAAFETILPFGHVTNFYLDLCATFKNISLEAYKSALSKVCRGNEQYQKNEDPIYPFPLGILNLV